ncbi:MAG: VWA domain-containing protein, partial [Planctomycetota bacterium]
FPDSGPTMARYDAIWLGEVHPDQLSAQDLELIEAFVAAGGGLIVVDGRFRRLNQLAAKGLGDLLPIRFRTRQPVKPPASVVPTATGLQQPSLALIDRSEQLESFWKQLPLPRWAADVELAEGAESWADLIWENGRRAPWLATRMYGSGRVFYFASDQSWRWRYKVADRFHVRFWNQMVVAAIEPPYSASDQFVAIGTDRVDYKTGESIQIRARLKDTRGNLVGDATVDAVVMKENTEVAVVPLAPQNPDRGTYAGWVSTLPGGEYSIRIRASGYDESALLATTPIWVGDENRREMLRLSLDESALRHIAASGEGEYVHESDADAMLPLLRPLSNGTIVESDTILWQSYYWFIPIIILLGGEWYLRKRAGLV